MRFQPWLPMLALILLVPAHAAAQAEPARRTRWDLQRFTWVRLERRESGAAPNEHPAVIEPGPLRGLLEGVSLLTGDGPEPLFTADELAHITVPITDALSQATPGEDVVLFSTFKRNGGFLTGGLTITARLFVTGGRLQLIVGEGRIDYAGPALAEVAPPMPAYGSRTVPGNAVLRARVGEPIRKDWLAFPMVSAVAPPVLAAPAPPVPPRPAERLLMLKELHDRHLITEEEYQKKRADILKDL